jgi:hypothetical protein
MGGLFSKPSKPKMPPPPPSVGLEGAAEAERERMRRRKAKGRSSTILSGSLGVPNQASVGVRSLSGL